MGPGQSLGARSWWDAISSGVEQRDTTLGRRLSLLLATARESAAADAAQLSEPTVYQQSTVADTSAIATPATNPAPPSTARRAISQPRSAGRGTLSNVAAAAPIATARSSTIRGLRDQVQAATTANIAEAAAARVPPLAAGTALMTATARRRMSVFDASSIGRALTEADIGPALKKRVQVLQCSVYFIKLAPMQR